MSEKQQHTSCSLREKMSNRYDDGHHHKHNKYHLLYRQHCRTHPVQIKNGFDKTELKGPTGLLRTFKLQKVRKRLAKHQFH